MLFNSNFLIKFIRKKIRLILDLFRIIIAWILYIFFRRVSTASQHAFVRLFCATSGRSNDAFANIISYFKPPIKIKSDMGVISPLSSEELIKAVEDLKSNGYYVFKEIIPSVICDRLLEFAFNNKSFLRPFDGQESKDLRLTPVTYNPVEPEAICYDYARNDLINNCDIQDIFSDYSLNTLAQYYLNAEPILDAVCMWWQTAFKKNADKSAAQFYHFDLDRVKWLKFFIYLTDVNTDNGPHTFIAGSHSSNGIPRALLDRGYTRLTDDEVSFHYSKNSFIEFNAPRGTIIAEDTRGLHKGKNVIDGHRLILQLQFSNCLFGLNNPSYAKVHINNILSRSLMGKIETNPRIFSEFTGT